MEENSEIQEDLGNGGKIKNWLQDNIRVILSVLIVATIMTGIYSYSKRTVVPTGDIDSGVEINLAEADVEDNNAVVVVGEDDNKAEKIEDSLSEKLSVEQVDKEAQAEADAAKQAEEAKKAEEAKAQAEADAAKQAEEAKKAEETISEETNVSFDETAATGESLTILARRATQHYLEKNPTEGLSAEHKIYIEDYLRKNIKHSARVSLGEKVSFSKDLIGHAVSMSKNLNENQLRNLQKYSAMVNGL